MKLVGILVVTLAVSFTFGCRSRSQPTDQKKENPSPATRAGGGSDSLPKIAATTLPRPTVTLRPRQKGDQEILDQFGVEVVGLRLSAAGYLLDFRYKVVDPEKAKPLLARANKPHLLHVKSKVRLEMYSAPKTGPLRSSTVGPEVGKIYIVEFANPGRLAHAGDEVEVLIGPFSSREKVLGRPGVSRPTLTEQPPSSQTTGAAQ